MKLCRPDDSEQVLQPGVLVAGQLGDPSPGRHAVGHPDHEVGFLGGVELLEDRAEGLGPGRSDRKAVDLASEIPVEILAR